MLARDLQPEPLYLCEGDVILTAGPAAPGLLSEPEHFDGSLGPDLQENADEITALVYRGQPFAVRTRIGDCYATLRTVYLLHGKPGLDEFFTENRFMPHPVGMGMASVVVYPDAPGTPRRGLYRLLDEARTCLLRQCGECAESIRAAAVDLAAGRLQESRQTVVSETIRYFRSADDAVQARRALESDMRWGMLIDADSADVMQLQAALARLRPAAARYESADRMAARAREDIQLIESSLQLHVLEACDDLEERKHFLITMEQALLERRAELPGLEAGSRQAFQQLMLEVSLAAASHPVLWRLYGADPARQPHVLGDQMMAALRATWRASGRLEALLRADPDEVWKLPALIHALLSDSGLAEFSLAATVAEASIASAMGRPAQTVSTVAGLTSLGLGGVAALAGTGPVIAPVTLGLFAVEAFAALVDALQVYQRYRLDSAAFDASLDPRQALAVDPSAIAALFEIGLNLMSLLPPARAAK